MPSALTLLLSNEHIIGFKLIIRRVGAKVGERPMAIVSHRYQLKLNPTKHCLLGSRIDGSDLGED